MPDTRLTTHSEAAAPFTDAARKRGIKNKAAKSSAELHFSQLLFLEHLACRKAFKLLSRP
ncbi:MAG: hypothetical protein RDA78_23375 [Roseibium sp.]|uniref:hypothetical protein n=1 Tax=Roseibium sp. TaxID=1936156 RepID=UPI003D9C24BD